MPNGQTSIHTSIHMQDGVPWLDFCSYDHGLFFFLREVEQFKVPHRAELFKGYIYTEFSS